MPRDYQRHKNNPYHLPGSLYKRVLFTVRDYDRMKIEVEDLILLSPDPEGGPKGNGPGDPTANAAMRIDSIQNQIRAIELALRGIPAEYRKGVFDSVRYRRRYPIDADRSTYARYKNRFIWFVAKNLGLIE